MESKNDIIIIDNLCKSFGSIQAVKNLSFMVKKGELFALLGTNGAGKTTTISIACGELQRDSGFVSICGYNIENDIAQIRKKIGVVFQSSLLDAQLSVKENLRSRAALYGITGLKFEQRFTELANILEFNDLEKRTVSKLSGGQKRKLDFARAIIHEPEVLFLDEPTTGLDPQTRNLLWKTVELLRTQYNITIILTTHYMEEAEEADYIVIMDSGKIAAKGTPLDLKKQYANDYIIFYNTPIDRVADIGYPYQKTQNGIRVNIPNSSNAIDVMQKNPELFNDFEIRRGNLEEVFLSITGKKLVGG